MNRPEVIINVASTLNGIIASDKGSLSLSSKSDWKRVHQLRATVNGVLVGINTILIDNPLLTIRLSETVKQPNRIILDSFCRTPLNAKIFKDIDTSPVIIFCSNKVNEKKQKRFKNKGALIEQVKQNECGRLNFGEIFDILAKKYSMGKILVEGGGTIITSLIKNRLVDKMFLYVAPYLTGSKNGLNLFNLDVDRRIDDAPKFTIVNTKKIGPGILFTLTLEG